MSNAEKLSRAEAARVNGARNALEHGFCADRHVVLPEGIRRRSRRRPRSGPPALPVAATSEKPNEPKSRTNPRLSSRSHTTPPPAAVEKMLAIRSADLSRRSDARKNRTNPRAVQIRAFRRAGQPVDFSGRASSRSISSRMKRV